MRKAAVAGLAVLVLAALGALPSAAAPASDPGITPTSILLGGTSPLTGPAAAYASVARGAKAYFDSVNAKGGVSKRRIDYKILDDGYNPANTVQATRQLVEQDKVFAVFGSLGTAPNLAIWSYLNGKKVPQALIATGDSYWGFSAKKYPWTIGYQPDYPGEAKIYGKYIASTMPGAKIGVLYQNDSYGKNYYAGLRVGLTEKKSQIVSAQSYDVTQTSLTQQILALKAAGADTLVIFATPSPTITALVTAAKVGWTPALTIINNVSANPLFLRAAAANGANVDGVVSTSYLVSATNPSQADTPGVKLANLIIGQYAPPLLPSLKAGDSNVVYGLGAAWTFVYALQHAGKNPTRASFMKALKSLNATDPFLYPGIKLQTSATDNFPTEQEILIKWSGGKTGDWTPFGSLYNHVR